MHVKLAAGRRVLDPRTNLHVPEDGINVSELDTYWVRRLRSGDVVRDEAVAAQPEPAKPEPVKSESVKPTKPTHKVEV
jgi:hypothetical protein